MGGPSAIVFGSKNQNLEATASFLNYVIEFPSHVEALSSWVIV